MLQDLTVVKNKSKWDSGRRYHRGSAGRDHMQDLGYFGICFVLIDGKECYIS